MNRSDPRQRSRLIHPSPATVLCVFVAAGVPVPVWVQRLGVSHAGHPRGRAVSAVLALKYSFGDIYDFVEPLSLNSFPSRRSVLHGWEWKEVWGLDGWIGRRRPACDLQSVRCGLSCLASSRQLLILSIVRCYRVNLHLGILVYFVVRCRLSFASTPSTLLASISAESGNIGVFSSRVCTIGPLARALFAHSFA